MSELPDKMKSAYELAMERLEQQQPSVKLTNEQKAKIAGIEEQFKARMAEREVFLNDQIAKASGRHDEIDALEKQLASELSRLREECESKKDGVRNGKE